jgi:hypothetical protein
MAVAGKGVCPDMVKLPIWKKANPRVSGKFRPFWLPRGRPIKEVCSLRS